MGQAGGGKAAGKASGGVVTAAAYKTGQRVEAEPAQAVGQAVTPYVC